MSEIKLIQDERGTALLVTLIFIFSLGIIVMSLAALVTADARVEILNAGERRAFYAAQSGIDYAMRSINEYAANNSNINSLDNYSEDLDTGNNTHSLIHFDVIGTDSVKIQATGYSQNYAKVIQKRIRFIDVASYAIYTKGKANYIRSNPAGLIMANATHMPFFDLDDLRDLAKPNQYYSGNLTLNSVFSFNREVLFVEGNLTFGRFNWINKGIFVAGKDVLIKSSILPFGTTVGAILQLDEKKDFLCQWQFLWRTLNGGLIAHGDVTGTSNHQRPFRFTVIHNRSRINNLLRHTVNGGPLIFTTSTWDNQ